MKRPTVCYLCGQPLSKPINRDHVPPQQFFAPEVRRANDVSRLITIPVHKDCNTAYKLDEDYFVHTLTPLVPGSYAGNALFKRVVEGYGKGREVALGLKIRREFDPRPSGLVLPDGKVVKRFDGDRLERIGWKVARGLHFHHYGEVLPVRWTVTMEIVGPDQTPPEHFLLVNSLAEMKSHGTYPGVFDYRFTRFDDPPMLYWGMLLWDRLIVIVHAHTPDCGCPRCAIYRSGSIPPDFLDV